MLVEARLLPLALPFFFPLKPSFLFSSFAALPVSFSDVTPMLAPKPLRVTVTPLTEAILRLLPATLPFSELVVVSRTSALTGALFLPRLELDPTAVFDQFALAVDRRVCLLRSAG